MLVDAGPPDAGVAAQLAERGIDRLAALVITHPDADHGGGAPELLAAIAVDHLGFARAPAPLLGSARAARHPGRAARRGRDACGRAACGCEVLWPPARLAGQAGPGEEPNLLSLVAPRPLARISDPAHRATRRPSSRRSIRATSTCSRSPTTAARTPASTALLAEAEPELAVISVGADNPYGHPAPATLAALARAGRAGAAHRPRRGGRDPGRGGGGWSVGAGLIRPSRALGCRRPAAGPPVTVGRRGGLSNDGSKRHPTAQPTGGTAATARHRRRRAPRKGLRRLARARDRPLPGARLRLRGDGDRDGRHRRHADLRRPRGARGRGALADGDTECFDGSSAQKTASLVLGWPSGVLAGIAALLASTSPPPAAAGACCCSSPAPRSCSARSAS